MNACPRDAIADALDEDGFLLPVVDEKRCVDCGLCERVCAATQPPELAAPSAANLFVHNDRDVLRNSTSGGAFTALSDCALAQNGAVVGAMMDEKLAIRHAVAESTGQRDRMRGSLYVQSDPNFVYRDVKALLEKGRFVLFVGTPCQVYGLKRFLNCKYDNLILVDFLCHGVPSASLLRAHIAWLEKLYRRQAKSYSFRSKKFGWRPAAIEEIVFQDGSRKSALPVQAYNKFFHNNVSLRASCLTCPFRRAERCSDLTVGDFWGVAKICGENCKFVIPDNANNTALTLKYTEIYGTSDFLSKYNPCISISKKANNTKIDLDWTEFHGEYGSQIKNDGKNTKISEWYVTRSWEKEVHGNEYWGT